MKSALHPAEGEDNQEEGAGREGASEGGGEGEGGSEGEGGGEGEAGGGGEGGRLASAPARCDQLGSHKDLCEWCRVSDSRMFPKDRDDRMIQSQTTPLHKRKQTLGWATQ